MQLLNDVQVIDVWEYQVQVDSVIVGVCQCIECFLIGVGDIDLVIVVGKQNIQNFGYFWFIFNYQDLWCVQLNGFFCEGFGIELIFVDQW